MAEGPKGAKPRETAVDVWRGLALVMIFINHLPGNPLENYTHRNFGLSDAAELFVLLAGYSSFLAYHGRFAGGQPGQAVFRTTQRAVSLYVAHLATTVIGAAIFAQAALEAGDSRVLEIIGLGAFEGDPLRGLVGLATLGFQPGYLNILPLYCVLILSLPAIMLLARLGRGALLAASVALYVATQVTELRLPNYPLDGSWFFNPLAWQLLFTCGFLVAMTRNEPLLTTRRPWLFWPCAAYLAVALVLQQRGYVPEPDALPVPRFLFDFDKQNLSLPRLLHVLALAYVVVHTPLHRLARRSTGRDPLALLGRHSLPVFCLGLVLSMAGLGLKVVRGTTDAFDLAWIGAGLGIQVLLAWTLSRAARDGGRKDREDRRGPA